MLRTTPIVIDEKILQRLMRRQQQDEREHSRTRQVLSRFRDALPVDGHEMATFGPRP
jgi:hypothetical protein